ncbi:MAG: GntR family transcriptional regulator [Pseudomonadota bacterium]
MSLVEPQTASGSGSGSADVIARRSLGRTVVERLREMIVEGTLPPGAKLNERELCERFGVSRTPLREAISLLETEGLVALAPHRGASVTPVTLAELDEVFPVMQALEALTGERAARLATAEDIAGIAGLHQDMLAEYARRDRAAYFRLNEAIHDRLLDAAQNPTLAATTRSLASRIRRARFQANLTEARWAEAVAEHEEIMAALEARDAARLAAILPAHLAAKLRALRLVLHPAET